MRGRGNCEHAAPTWTGTKPSPTPLPRPPKPRTSSNPGLSNEQVAPLATCQDRPFGSTPSSGRRGLSPNRTLTRRARPPTRADQVQTAALQFRRLSNGDATARPHRSPSLPRNASPRWYSPAPAVLWQPRTYVPTPAVSANPLSLGCSAEAPPR